MLKNKRTLYQKLGLFLAILGPGIITGSVDNDAGGITTYSVSAAIYGYNLIWTLIPSFIVLVVIQEMNARMGIVTGKGLADLIRENYLLYFYRVAYCRYWQYYNRVCRSGGQHGGFRGK
jgi:Mn2+/Fe2+ NRAMP family transporter